MGKKLNKAGKVSGETTALYDRVTKAENEIMDRFGLIKKRNLKRQDACQHLVLSDECPDYLPTEDYHGAFWRTFLMNQIKRTKLEWLEEKWRDWRRKSSGWRRSSASMGN